MIIPNLNPAQLKSARPQSASLRTPRGGDSSFNRMQRDGQATPRLAPKPEAEAGEEEPWLFRYARCCSTAEVWRMGFSRVVVFSTANWADAAAPVRELNEAFRPRQPIADLSRASTEALQAAIAPTFQRGDVLFTINCVRPVDSNARLAIRRNFFLSFWPPIPQVHEYADWADDERARASAAVAKLIDAVSEVWLQYDAMDDPELGAVVVILENSKATALAAEYGPDDKGMEYPVTELDEQLSAFFR